MLTTNKTNSIVRSILGILLTVVLLTTACLITSFAAGDNHGTVDVFPALGVSSDTMNVNNGTINTLYGGGNVKDNKGTIFSSHGTVNENHGTIEGLIAGNVGTNYKTINRIENTGSLGVNDEGGTVGFVGMGNEVFRNDGTIQVNIGNVSDNYGTVSDNYGTVIMHDGQVVYNYQNGIVTFEAKISGGETIPAKGTIDNNEGHVKIHSGTVTIKENTGDIEITNATVTVSENAGSITLGTNATLKCDVNKSDGVITKTDKSASIIYGIADGRIVDETAAWYKIVFEGDDGKAVVKECDKEENGVYYTQSGSIVTFTLPSEYECSAGMIWESGNVNTWVMNADPAEGDTEFTISCHKCTPGNYWMTTEKHWQICAECGKMLAETEGAHTFGEFVPNDDATCVNDGTETGKCTVCGYKRTRTAVDSHLTSDHHEHIVIDQRVEPTETSTGLTQGSHCEDCNKVLTAQEIIPKIPHTCVSSSDYLYDGSTHWKICSICNEKFDEETHNNGNLVLNTEATCTEKATYYMQCDICGAVDHTQIVAAGDPLGHNFVNYISDGNATCTADGTKTAKCDSCDATDTQPDVGSATGHSFTTYTSNNDATCTADGTKTATCANGCGVTDTVADTGSAKGHTYGDWVTIKEATETETGTKERTCSACGNKDTGIIPVLEHIHNVALQNGTAATCTTAGCKDYYTCSCGLAFEDATRNIQIVDFDVWKAEGGNGYLAPKGHTYGEWAITKEPTLTEKGMKERSCTVCGDKQTEELPVLTPTTYSIISVANGEWTKSSSDGLAFTSDADFAKFVCVVVDGTEIAATNYTAVSGSTKVTLNAAYLETLSVGSHSIDVVSNDGTASTSFTVKVTIPADPTNPTSPQTGDNSHMLLWIALLFISGGVLVGTTVYGRKKKYNAD